MKKYYRKGTKIRFYLILTLIVLLITSIGYAVFTEQLNISGTVSGNATFRVYFIEAWAEDSTKGTAEINTDEDTVTYTATLSYPGDRVLIGAKIKNESSVAVKLNDFTPTSIASNSDIKFDYVTLDTSTEILQPNEICDYEFVIYWDSYENQTVTNPTSQTFEITLDYEQYTGETLLATTPVQPTHEHWTQTGTTVTNGVVTLTVGSVVTGYSVTVDGTTYGDGNWYVLGAKNGELLITTNTCPETVILSGRDGYTNGIATLNTRAASYTNSTYADGNARTIDADDINRVTGYDPTTYATGSIYEYGNEVTYYWQGSNYPYYSGSNGVTGTLSGSHSAAFYYPTATGWNTSTKSSNATVENKEKIITLTNKYYSYQGSLEMDSNSVAYTLLFANTGENPGDAGSYWLGTEYVYCGFGYDFFNLCFIYGGMLNRVTAITHSGGAEGQMSMGLRPVVSLKTNVNVTSNGVISIN